MAHLKHVSRGLYDGADQTMNLMRRDVVKRFLCGVFLAALLTACNFPAIKATPVPSTETTTPPAMDPMQEDRCAYQWTSKPQPDLSMRLEDALGSAGLSEVRGNVTAFGEDCIDTQTSRAVRFTAMNSEFDIMVTVEDLNDLDALAELVQMILRAADTLPEDELPGPQPARMRLALNSDGERIHLNFAKEDGLAAMQQGLTGMAFLEALGFQP
jgi:hypothetical protein